MKWRCESMRGEAAFRPTGFRKSSQWLIRPLGENDSMKTPVTESLSAKRLPNIYLRATSQAKYVDPKRANRAIILNH
jgi:hypothetical protein